MGPAVTKNQSVVELPLNHPRFMLAKVISNGQTRSVQTTMGVDDKGFDKWSHKLDQMKLKSQNLLLPTQKSFSTKGLCGSSGTLTLNYDDYPYLLTEQIYNRKGRKSHFDEVELWYLLYALLKAKSDILAYSPKVGDIRPLNIFLNQNGQVKVANVFSWPNESTNFQKAIEGQVTYLAPQEVKMLETGQTLTDDHVEEEIFTIGLTVLSTGILTDSSDLYNLKNNKFDYNTAQNRLNQWKSSPYSEVLRGVVANLCDFDKSKRMSANEVTTWISNYEAPIKKRTNFIINDAPFKVHATIKQILTMIIPLTIGTAISQNIKTTQSVYRPVSVPFNPTSLLNAPVNNNTVNLVSTTTVNTGTLGTKFTYQSPNEVVNNPQQTKTVEGKPNTQKDIKFTDQKQQEQKK